MHQGRQTMARTGDRLHITLRPSKILLIALGFAYAGAAACVTALGLSAVLTVAMLGLLALSAFCDWRTYSGRDPRRRISELVLNADGRWLVVDGEGRIASGAAGVERLVHPLAVSFTLERAEAKPIRILILPDMIEEAHWRGLRVWLRGHGRNEANHGGRG